MFRWRSKTEKFAPQWILSQVAVFGTDLDVFGIEVPYFSSSFFTLGLTKKSVFPQNILSTGSVSRVKFAF
jgi:hypothetical protein